MKRLVARVLLVIVVIQLFTPSVFAQQGEQSLENDIIDERSVSPLGSSQQCYDDGFGNWYCSCDPDQKVCYKTYYRENGMHPIWSACVEGVVATCIAAGLVSCPKNDPKAYATCAGAVSAACALASTWLNVCGSEPKPVPTTVAYCCPR